MEDRLRSINSQLRGWSELIFASARQHHALISDKSRYRKIISILTRYRKEMQHFCNVFQRTILQRMSTEVNVYIRGHQALFCTHYIGNIIYHRFSHSDVSYRFNGKTVNVLLECWLKAISCGYSWESHWESDFNEYLQHMSFVTRKPVFRVCVQSRLKPPCSGIEASWRLKILDIETDAQADLHHCCSHIAYTGFLVFLWRFFEIFLKLSRNTHCTCFSDSSAIFMVQCDTSVVHME